MSSDTIFALASGPIRAAVSVIRISGEETAAIVSRLCGPLPAPRRAVLRAIRSIDGELLDRGLVLWLPGPGSYTGEDSAELQVHGGPAVVRAIAAALARTGARPADAGEFTRRAFMHGRMDLLEAEGVADLVAAETDLQRRHALRELGGEQSQLVHEWAERVRSLLAWQEALIDFPDEDLPPEVEAALHNGIHALQIDLRAAQGEASKAARVREGLVIAVIGAPNVGKSSLVNALAARDVAIVAATPGTTRDALEVRLELAGVPVTLIDTAGLRATDDPIEFQGVERARARAAQADIVMRVIAAGDTASPDSLGLPGDLLVANKIDRAAPPPHALGVSAQTGAGLDALIAQLESRVRDLSAASGPASLNRPRHAKCLRDAAEALERAEIASQPELRGEDLRAAMTALGRITGAVDVEMLLDTVFSSFCIGK